jgi:hypothetical protein
VVNNHFIKLRATFPLSANKEYDLRDKTRDLFEGLLKDTQFKSKDKSKTVINLDADSSEVQLDVMYGIAVKAMMTKDLIVDFKQFVSVYDNMVKITKELVQQGKMKTVGDKEILSLVEIDEAGFLNEVIWLGYHQDYWQKPSDLKIDDFKQWIKSQNITEVSLRPKGVEVLIKR